jgi:cell division protein FtsI (penicillin-binding protein 3)
MYDNTMPNVKGMGARDAIYVLESRGLAVTLSGHGKVVSQSVPAGVTVKKGRAVTLTLK